MEQSEPGSDNPRQRTVTPLPKIQVFIVILMQLTEPISATVIFPFINQLVLSTGVTNGDEKKSGYYAGIIVCHDFNLRCLVPLIVRFKFISAGIGVLFFGKSHYHAMGTCFG